MIPSFPKIFTVGTKYITELFNAPVEVTEKVDGSQFAFGRINGQLYYRSKGAQIFPESVDAMFKVAVENVSGMEVPDNTIFYCEYLRKNKHNILTYGRTPIQNLMLFGVMTAEGSFITEHQQLVQHAQRLGIEAIPLLYSGTVASPEQLKALLDTESVLGGPKIEGVVVKNYSRPMLIGGQVLPLTAGKLVREDFKEVLKTDWAKEHTGKSKWETYLEGFRTEARWEKAVQHLRDGGTLTESPKDIGNLMTEVKSDITQECKEEIKEFLWKVFGHELLRNSVAGLPEWYKERLMQESFK